MTTTKYMLTAGRLRGLNTAPRPTVRYNDCEVIDIDADDDCNNTPTEPADHIVIPMAPSPDDDCNDLPDTRIPYRPNVNAALEMARRYHQARHVRPVPYLVVRHPNGDRWTAPTR